MRSVADIALNPSQVVRFDVHFHYYMDNALITLLPCAVESHPTPGDSRGSSSPSRSIFGDSSHVADGGSARIPLEWLSPRAQSSLMQPLVPLTPVSIPV